MILKYFVLTTVFYSLTWFIHFNIWLNQTTKLNKFIMQSSFKVKLFSVKQKNAVFSVCSHTSIKSF